MDLELRILEALEIYPPAKLQGFCYETFFNVVQIFFIKGFSNYIYLNNYFVDFSKL